MPANAAQSVTLAWDPNPETDIAAYVIHYGTTPRGYTQSTNVGNVTTATVYGLAEGATWYFAITARNTAGLESAHSNEITNAIPASVTNQAPTITALPDVTLRAGQTTNLSFTIWDLETNPSNLEVTATTTNQTVLPLGSIALSGSAHARTITLAPAMAGITPVTVLVSDGPKAASTSFLLTVLPVPRPPANLWINTLVRFGSSPDGPWTDYLSTSAPFPMDTNFWWQAWK